MNDMSGYLYRGDPALERINAEIMAMRENPDKVHAMVKRQPNEMDRSREVTKARLKMILQLHTLGLSNKQIAPQTKCSATNVGKIIKRHHERSGCNRANCRYKRSAGSAGNVVAFNPDTETNGNRGGPTILSVGAWT